MRVRGVVVRLVIDPERGTFKLEHRTRDLHALLSEAEWGWSTRKDDAYVFEEFSLPASPRADAESWSAEAHALALKKAGDQHVHAAVFGRTCERERAEREVEKARGPGMRLSPEDAYAITLRRQGEREIL